MLRGQIPVIFEANTADEIRRALDLAEEFNVNVIISGGAEAWRLVDRLKARRVPQIISLKFPEEPDYGKKDSKRQSESPATQPASQPSTQPAKGAEDKERIYEPLKLRRERRRLWEEQVANVIRLHEAGISFALSTREFDKPTELFENLRLVIERGLPEEAALAALTGRPAEMFGLDKQLGTIAPGRLANLTILDKALADKEATVRYVVVDGNKFDLEAEAKKKPDRDKNQEKESAKANEAEPATTRDDVAESQADQEEDSGPDWRCEVEADRIPKTRTGGNVLIRGATVIPVTGEAMPGASILVTDGKIAAIGPEVTSGEGVTVIEAAGRYVVPGLIDAHSHMSADNHNESTLAISAEVRIRDVLRRRSVSVYRALAGGATSALILHGSSNPIGGQSQVIKFKYDRPVSEMVVQDAPPTIKFALGENVTQANWEKDRGKRFPDTRMGVEATMRRALTAANHYAAQRADLRAHLAAGQDAPPLRTDLRLEALAEVLAGERYVHCHCYRADEILRLLAVAEEFGFRIACLQHVLEGYRVAPEIARHGCGASTFANAWGYKIEAFDAIPHNAALMTEHGVCTSLNSDSANRIRYLQLEAAKGIKWGGLNENQALRLITINPARQLGIDHRVGSIEIGKDADLAIFNGHPLNAFSKCVMTLIEGEVYFEDDHPESLGQRSQTTATRNLRSELAMPLPVAAAGEIPATPHRLYAIVGATVHPISGPPIDDATVVIRNDTILAVGKEVSVPPGAGLIEAAGLHVYPGLIDAGSNLGMMEIWQVASTRDNRDSASFAADLRVSGSINPHSVHIPIARSGGITTALARPSGGYVSGQSAVIHLNGWTLPELMFSDPYALHMSVPVLPIHLPAKERKKRESEHKEKLREIERFLAKARRYAERLAASGAGPDSTAEVEDPESRNPQSAVRNSKPDLTLEAMIPYRRGEKPVVFAASSYKAILETIEFADKHELRCVISGGAQAWKLADTLAEKKIPVILGPVTSYPRGRFEAWDSVYSCAAALDRAGVEFCFASGSSAGAYNLPTYAGLAVAHGLDPERAEYALTLGAARILGIDDRTGSIEPGKQADLIVTTHSPLQTVFRVTHMFIDGRPIDLTNKHTGDYQRFKNRPRPTLPPPPELLGPPSLTE
ncbi:MAG: amidohydrolase family protein [Planctomycetota bacterium]